ncbi:response regulator [Sulfurihydrogenibium azorense]|jgi:two-component system OmpR family response regulator|uniref:Two-component response regulator n=1 Tax=Sulfurihydrogenibium azorense (strain DSM 15241 / OCM 825 / Az-Fu1) TaxID=204536 RepID=C1DUS4_SULAA|nr:response regulator transcription factor [Sulfurihydrogenibium azorense]ACN99416.1 two-component response regulator [Sulfurihydrogenibium azorense Az-Fu1]MDM7274059.1 response regulator transcription factor [Sulfurihydrogenibium azorense]
MIKVIMIEDDKELAELLTQYLAKFNISVKNFEDPVKALQELEKNKNYDIMILDLSLPQMDGIEVCKKVAKEEDIPIIISSARSDDTDKIVALEVGADDYLAKPYNPRELVARIQAVLRRKEKKPKTIVCGEFELDEEGFTIKKNGEPLNLTSAEFELLSMLIKNKGRVLTRDYILDNTIHLNYDSIDRTVDVIIGRIRKKIGDDPKNPKYIISVRGLGYKFEC